MPRRSVLAAMAVTGAVLAVLAGCGSEDGSAPEASDPPAATPPSDAPTPGIPGSPSLALGGLEATLSPSQALDVLAGLPAAPARPVRDYDRDDYGERWEDIDGNGCNQRDDVLVRDAVPGTLTVAQQGECDHDVLAGAWDDPYTGERLQFDDLKDPDQAQAIPIDHLVALSEAHQSGADRWTADEREFFANDLGNLLAVDGDENQDKGDSDPAEWMPPYQPSHCAYAVLWVEVKDLWGLGVDAAERRALQQLLESC